MKATTITFCDQCGASVHLYHWDTAYMNGLDWGDEVAHAVTILHRAVCPGFPDYTPPAPSPTIDSAKSLQEGRGGPFTRPNLRKQ